MNDKKKHRKRCFLHRCAQNNGFSENNKDYRGCFKRKSRDEKIGEEE